MSVRLICVVFLVCQFSCFGTSTSPYGSDSNGHVGKKGRPEPRHQDKDRPRISESQTCINDFRSRSNYIIRTTESLENDAVFIDSIKVESSEICIENCCETNGNEDESSICDVAVFVNSDDAAKNRESNCFLFQCRFETAEGERNRCKFAEHDGYVSNMYGGFEEEAVFPNRVRNKQQEVKEKIKEEEEIPQTKQPAPKITESGGDIVETEDSDEKDVPQACNDEHQFQCDNGDCIRLTLLCDDYNDCADYSDEKDATCKELDGLYKIWQYMYDNSAADYATDYPPAAPGGQDKDKIETNEDGIADEHTGMGVDDNEKEIVKIPTTNKILKTEQDNGDSPVEVELMETQKSGTPSEDPISDQSSSSSNSKSGSKSSEVKEKTGTKTENTVANSDVRVTDAQSAVTATAVLPLTIGLFLTLFLLLMMSCRLRYMNRRLRYGRLKTNNAHDADYLINGMYL